MEKLTIHRALVELKLIDSKIEKHIKDQMPVAFKQKGKKIANIWSDAEFINNAKSSLDSITALIERKVKIKCAIIEANSKTSVTIAGKKMTIAEAITYKGFIELQKSLIADLQAKYTRTKADMEKGNMIVDKNLQQLLEVSFGKDSVKTDPSDVKNITDSFLEINRFHLVDPLGIEDVIERLTKDITTFEADVDACLSEINATTFIEI